MRPIKFRAWNNFQKKMIPWDRALAVQLWYLLKDEKFSLMEFTGLLDKNGKEIYEGDIIHHEIYGRRGQVIWEHGGFRIQGDDLDTYLGYEALKRTKIIGNIYENPELKEAP